MKFEYVKMTTEVAMNTPSVEVFVDGNFVVSKSFIPYTHTEAKVCYFVDSKNDDSYGSCASLEEAKKRIQEIKKGIQRENFTK